MRFSDAICMRVQVRVPVSVTRPRVSVFGEGGSAPG